MSSIRVRPPHKQLSLPTTFIYGWDHKLVALNKYQPVCRKLEIRSSVSIQGFKSNFALSVHKAILGAVSVSRWLPGQWFTFGGALIFCSQVVSIIRPTYNNTDQHKALGCISSAQTDDSPGGSVTPKSRQDSPSLMDSYCSVKNMMQESDKTLSQNVSYSSSGHQLPPAQWDSGKVSRGHLTS